MVKETTSPFYLPIPLMHVMHFVFIIWALGTLFIVEALTFLWTRRIVTPITRFVTSDFYPRIYRIIYSLIFNDFRYY